MAVHELLQTEEAGFHRDGNFKIMARWGSVQRERRIRRKTIMPGWSKRVGPVL